ncbi:hypothetical protein JB92DRAFT_3102528 [Gautieria morchelliformis]|nr:hypothetical protein JB92DRAFT_3102528 [Gautieria morchelliformis]
MAEITNVDDRCEEEATQLQSHSQSTPPQGQDHLDATSASSLRYTPYNNKSNTAYTNAASIAYTPSAMNAALGSGGVTYGAELGMRPYRLFHNNHHSLPPTLTPSTLPTRLPHLPHAHRLFAHTRRLSDSGLGIEADEMDGGMVVGGGGGERGVPTSGAAHDIRAKLHVRAIRGYSACLRVSLADDLDAKRERLAAIGHEQPGPLTEHGFGFEGGGMGAHDADDGNRFDAYGDMNVNGDTYGHADTNVYAFTAEDAYSYTDADADSVICTKNANAQSERSHERERKSEKHQRPIISGLPGAAREGGATIRFMRVLKEAGTYLGRLVSGMGTGSGMGV